MDIARSHRVFDVGVKIKGANQTTLFYSKVENKCVDHNTDVAFVYIVAHAQ